MNMTIMPNTNSTMRNLDCLSWDNRKQVEKIIGFCFSQLFCFEAELVADEGDYASSQERDAAPKPIPLSRDVLPPLRLDVEMFPETILVPAADGSIYGDLHPFIALPVNLANGYKKLPYKLRLVLTHRYGFRRSPEEIAETLRYARSQVYDYLNQAIVRLAPYLLELELEVERKRGVQLEIETVNGSGTASVLTAKTKLSNKPASNKKPTKFAYLKS